MVAFVNSSKDAPLVLRKSPATIPLSALTPMLVGLFRCPGDVVLLLLLLLRDSHSRRGNGLATCRWRSAVRFGLRTSKAHLVYMPRWERGLS